MTAASEWLCTTFDQKRVLHRHLFESFTPIQDLVVPQCMVVDNLAGQRNGLVAQDREVSDKFLKCPFSGVLLTNQQVVWAMQIIFPFFMLLCLSLEHSAPAPLMVMFVRTMSLGHFVTLMRAAPSGSPSQWQYKLDASIPCISVRL